MSRPKGSAQFEGDVDKAVKEFLRSANLDERWAVLIHVDNVLRSMSDKAAGDYIDAVHEVTA